MDTISNPKKEMLLKMLQQGLTMLHINAKLPDVAVPAVHKDNHQLALNLSYRFADTDMEVDDDKVEATLSFGGAPFRCVIPLDAIWGLSQESSSNTHIFNESLPPEMLFQFLAQHIASSEKDLDSGERPTPWIVMENELSSDEWDAVDESMSSEDLYALYDTSSSEWEKVYPPEEKPASPLRLVVDNKNGCPREGVTPLPASRPTPPQRPFLRVVSSSEDID